MNHRAELVIHPATHSGAVQRIAVAIEGDAADTRLSFEVAGDIAGLRLPETAEAMRTDSLWQHSCFELFLRPDGSDSYYEFNLAPSSAWAAYRFAARRQERAAPEFAAPAIVCRRGADFFSMTARLRLAGLPQLAGAAAIHAGLAAVIEDARGMHSYWALAHASREPDFHDPSTFRLRLAAP